MRSARVVQVIPLGLQDSGGCVPSLMPPCFGDPKVVGVMQLFLIPSRLGDPKTALLIQAF